MKKIIIKDKKYTLDEIYEYCSKDYSISLSKSIIKKIHFSRKIVDEKSYIDDPVYGINTGFGKLSQVKIDNKDLHLLQSNLLISHAVGV